MLKKLLEKIKHAGVTIRFTLLSIFIALFSFGMLSLIGITHYRMSNNIALTSSDLMEHVANAVYNEVVSTQMQSAKMLSQTLADHISQGTVDPDNLSSYLPYTYSQLKLGTLPIVEEIEWGDEKGNAYLQEKRPDGTILTEVIYYPGQITTQFRDHNEKIISRVKEKIIYDPRIRPWYIAAKNAKQFTWTELFTYRLASYGLLGIGAVTPVYYKNGDFRGVVFIGIRMDYFGEVIRNIKASEHSTINIMTKEGKLFATSDPKAHKKMAQKAIDIQQFSIPGLIKSYNHFIATGEKEFIFNENGKRYIANYHSLPQQNWLIAVLAPEDDFIGELRKSNMITISIGFFILILGIIIVSRAVNGIIKPLKSIANETEKIKNFNLEQSAPIQSKIKEIARIGDAIYNMKNGLRSFQKYVPATLVRQLIEKKEDAIIGGVKQKLVVLFSDIANFTHISEQLSPNELMLHLCDYLNALSHIISKNRGTIDKYIGDSIMAFWGAPLPEKLPNHQAAKTALECKQCLLELNTRWEAEKKPRLFTRIGIHYGEAIVGNVGSDERLSYTAIGDAINMASRLEGINKVYGTQIVVSETVYEEIKNQFVLRMLDRVTVKGKIEAVNIYELLAEKIDQITFNVLSYSKLFSLGFSSYQKKNWDEAIHYFSQCLPIFPDDAVAPLFVARCNNFKKTPPNEPWDGTWHLQEK